MKKRIAWGKESPFVNINLFRKMKLIVLLTAISLLQLSATSSYAQSTKLSMSLTNVTLEEVIATIEEQTEFVFFYNNAEIDLSRKVSFIANKNNIKEVLDDVFGVNNYRLENKKVVLLNNKSNATQQEKKITGTITDEKGETIIGANVVVKGTTNGTVTDFDGNFSLLANAGSTLQISYIGYYMKEITVGSSSTYQIKLKENTQILDEVVVVGYGTVKRANLGGAVSTTDAKTFEARPVSNAATALQGKMAGLTVIRTGGEAPTIRIRDVSSINGGSPLVLIDGAEGDLNTINPADIDNVSVLKDGTAAIYGARAADGVVLITTKKGKKNQKLSVGFNANYSIKKPALLKRAANLYEHAAMALEITDGSFPIEYTADELELIRQNSDQVLPAADWGRWSGYPKFYKNQDYNDMLIGNGNIQNYNVNLSGGGEKYTFLISLGHQREDGLLKFGKDLEKRYYVRAKSSIELHKNLTYDLNLSYEASDRGYSSAISEGQNIWELIYKSRSWAPLRNPAGNFYTFEGFDNPAQVLEEGGMSNKTTGNFTINNQLRLKIIDGLEITGQAVIRKTDYDKSVINKMIYSRNWDDVNHRIASRMEVYRVI